MAELPPWSNLQTVEAVARLGSFKSAAEELFITPSAVSHRIRGVEEQLGQLLFDRVGQGIVPRPGAADIGRIVRSAHDEMLDVWSALRNDVSGRPLKVSCLTTFANHFILPNLADLKTKFQRIDLDLHSAVARSTSGAGQPDIVIGLGPHPEHEWAYEDLFAFEVRPVCSPASLGTIIQSGKLIGPLLGFGARPHVWQTVAAEMDLELDPGARPIAFDSLQSACLAASKGVGVALAPDWVAAEWLDTGQLVGLGDKSIPMDASYWIAVRRGEKNLPHIQRFQRWIRSYVGRRFEV